MPPQLPTDETVPTVSFDLSGADPRICGSAVCLRSAFDDRLLLFQKVKIFKALLLFSAGRPGSSCQSALALCVLYERRGRLGPLRLKWFYWGQALGGHLHIVVRPLCAAERVTPSERDVDSLWGHASQIEIWHS